MSSFEFSAVEQKWQQYWADNATNTPDLTDTKNKFYNLMMFPYPSADGLHIGNIYAFTGADIQGRYRRLTGSNVFQPIGFDAFGINAENFAIKNNTHPAVQIPANIENFRGQLERMGIMYDWTRSVDTTQADYYRWTQWIFVKFFEKGLVEHREAPVNWCPDCKTVLSNEQVIDGFCERCGTKVELRVLKQWFFKITDFAERLLDNIDRDDFDWSPSTKLIQKNWIGRSNGAEVAFSVPNSDDEVRVFTTRPDTIMGVTFVVLAPEHPMVAKVTTDAQRAAVDAYVAETQQQDITSRRRAEQGDKSGLPTGGHVIHPITGKQIPIYVADYVMMDYGSGAVMGVAAHDTRDFEFATRHDLPIIPVIACSDDPNRTQGDMAEAYTEKSDDDRLINSGAFDGMSISDATAAITAELEKVEAGQAKTTYRLKDWCVSRQRYWGPPIPIIHCDSCGPQAVPEQDLPVLLPDLEDFRPSDEGTSPLSKVADFVNTTCPKCGEPAKRETDVSDTFLDSAWYFLRYPSVGKDAAPFDPETTRDWLPVDMYIGGQEHAVLHLLYSRFVTMALSDMGYLDFEEPFKSFRRHGMIVREGQKMSKSKGNVVGPDEYVSKYGADVIRCYLMFMGPFTEGGDFRDSGISGIVRFMRRLWTQMSDAATAPHDPAALDDVDAREYNATVKKVGEDLAQLQYNTAIARLMEFSNHIRGRGRNYTLEEARAVCVMLAPFAPHTAEEIWQLLGGSDSVFAQGKWPEFDETKLLSESVTVVVQVKGKRRAELKLPKGSDEAAAKAAALADDAVKNAIGDAEIKRFIYVPDRIVNIVI